MKIAIVGAGFCGLACAWHLVQNHSVTLFDAKGIGAGASGVPCGLLHTYSGPKAKLCWQAQTAFPEALLLLQQVSERIGRPLFYQRGILRPEVAGMDFSNAKNSPDTEWWEAEKCQKIIPELAKVPGLYIRSGILVDCPAYLQGLVQVCTQNGMVFEQAQIFHPQELSGFDKIIFTVGSGQGTIRGLNAPPISLIKGQTLVLERGSETSLPFPLNAEVQISQLDGSTLLYAGATFERRWNDEGADRSCESELRAKIAKVAPGFSELPLQGIWVGFRAATNDKKPFLSQTGENVFCIGGMGSKGLLYHAWMAKQLIQNKITR